MLQAVKEKSRSIIKAERVGNALYLYSELDRHRLMPYTDKSLRISYTYAEAFSERKKPGVIASPSAEWSFYENEKEIVLETSELTVKINRESAQYKYFSKDGTLLLCEAESEGRELEEFTTTIISDEEQTVEKIKTADGEKETIKQAHLIDTGKAYHTKLRLEFADGEYLYGLGQHEEGYGSLRGKTVYCHQSNRKNALPLLVSNKGYGILTDTYSPYIFNDIDFGSYIYTEADDELDFYFIAGGSMANVIKEYRVLTGKAVLFPKWAYGYWQSKERFESQEEIERVANEYRKRNIGIDCLVLDWSSWESDKWGEKLLDKSRFPAPNQMLNNLHNQNLHFMISIWPNPNANTENHKQLKDRGLLLPSSVMYNAFSDEARELYWKQTSEGLFSLGVDAWWCDSCEPISPEWSCLRRPEPSKQFVQYQTESAQYFDATMTNAYGFYHNKGISEGQRKENSDKRVTILTRSTYTGAQRHGTVLWSGDIAANWDTLKRQIATGLGFCASGHPYWTIDIGAFFVKNAKQWFWKGDYDNTTDDLGYRELFVRWYQWGGFLPIFRGHGTDCNRELWNFGEEGTPFYDAIIKANRLRYELMPYIYSASGKAWLEDESIMRYLAFDYPDDKIACETTDQYMFGDSIMVCPVTRPMYYEKNSKKIETLDTSRKIYLPKGKWYDYYTNEAYEGGSYITVDAPLDKIPLFVKAGAIIPTTDFALSTAELGDKLYINVYTGADGEFTYYNDSGDGYSYENGEYELYKLRYNDAEQKLNSCELLKKDGLEIRYI